MSDAVLAIIVAVAIVVSIATLIVMRSRAPSAVKPGPHPGSSLAGGVIIGGVCLILVVLLSAAYTTYTVQQSQHQWCDTLALLTSHTVPKPANPAANPSRELAYVYYLDFISLRGRFGCG